MTDIRKETITNIRGCLISVRGKIDLRQLCKDYKQLIGTDIPFRKLGFNTLEDFLKSEPSLSVSRSHDGQILVDAKVNEKSSHISDMVQRQKAVKRKPPKLIKRYSSHTYNTHEMQAPNRWRPKNVNTKWKSTYELRPSIPISHNQFVKLPSNNHFPPPPTTRPIAPKKEIHMSMNYVKPNIQPTVNNKPNIQPTVNNKPNIPPIVNNKPNNLIINNKPKVPIADNKPKLEVITPEAKALLENNMRKNLTLNDKIPHSTKTNRSVIMNRGPSPSFIDNLKIEAMAAIDITDPMWSGWTSSDSEPGESNVEKPPFKATGDAVVDFYSFLKYHKLSDPVYKVCQRKARPHKPTFYDCQVKVDGLSTTSYPKDFNDEMQAKYYASQLALEKLMAKYGTKRQMLLLSDEKDILERIPPLVQKHFCGIWSSQLEADYKDLYKEQLPSNWLEIVDTSPVISMESFDNRYVLQYFNPEDRLLRNKQNATATSSISIPTSTVDFNEQGVLLAEITCAVSAKEIWCRQVETPDAESFDIMINTMDKWYSDHYTEIDPPIFEKDGFYAAWHDSMWHRVRLLEIDGEDYQCLFVDRGDDQKISADNVFTLVRPFAKEKAQAFICRLAGLEELYEVSVGSEHIQNLEGLVVQIEPCLEETGSSPYEPICVSLCDLDTKEIVNEYLISAISIENALPSLVENVPTEIFVTNVENNGDVYLQIHTPGYDKLISLLSDLEISMSTNKTNMPTELVTPDNSKNRLYFIRGPKDKHHNRVKIIDWSPDLKYAQIYYVDRGHASVVTVKEIIFYPLDMISSVISLYPEQALKVRLKLDGLPSNFVEDLKELLPKDSSTTVLGMVSGKNKDGMPILKMFTRMQNVGLVSINEKLAEIRKQRDLRPEPATAVEGVRSTGVLKSPTLPEIGAYFEVTVSSAVSPWNFFVQPYDTFEERKKLMVKLQKKYANVLYSPLSIDDIKPGQIYASKYEDGSWYRTCVIKVIHSSSISVFLCDFGHYSNLRLQQLIPLDPEFMELPFQAIKAKLSGIKPKNEKWTMEDCRYFQRHVCKKSLVSVLTSIEKDELYKCDKIVGLKLIDTSNKEQDVHIEQLLIQKLIAVTVNN